jgi:Tol biopolymer transport system component
MMFVSWNLSRQSDWPAFQGAYLDQPLPGLTPVRFSSEILQTDHRIHSSPAFSPDLNEVYWSVLPRESKAKYKNEMILFSRKMGASWSSPKVAAFSGEYADGGPVFSRDGKKIFFYSQRPPDNKSRSVTSGEIWCVERQDGDWGKPRHIKLDFEGEQLFFSVSENGNIYFTSGHGPGGTGTGAVDIYCAKFWNGNYEKPERLPDVINSERFVESDPLISADEKALIFYSLEKPTNIGQYDLYISWKTESGPWEKPINLGASINSGYARFPRFSPDGKFLFFVSMRSGKPQIYWVDAKILEELRLRKER